MVTCMIRDRTGSDKTFFPIGFREIKIPSVELTSIYSSTPYISFNWLGISTFTLAILNLSLFSNSPT